jgi:hypothetical protein
VSESSNSDRPRGDGATATIVIGGKSRVVERETFYGMCQRYLSKHHGDRDAARADLKQALVRKFGADQLLSEIIDAALTARLHNVIQHHNTSLAAGHKGTISTGPSTDRRSSLIASQRANASQHAARKQGAAALMQSGAWLRLIGWDARVVDATRPTLLAWAERHEQLSTENAAVAKRWRKIAAQLPDDTTTVGAYADRLDLEGLS